jgi:hypothetical protein
MLNPALHNPQRFYKSGGYKWQNKRQPFPL